MAISIVRVTIKLIGRIDRLMAEKAATTGDMVLPMPPVVAVLLVVAKARELTEYVDKTKGEQPDPLGNDRGDIVKLLQDRETVTACGDAKIIADKITRYFETYLPQKAVANVIVPDSEYLTTLKQLYPTLNLDEPETRLAAFYIRVGKDDRTIGYAGRVVLLVVDVLAEFGAENTSLFVRDKTTQAVVKECSRVSLSRNWRTTTSGVRCCVTPSAPPSTASSMHANLTRGTTAGWAPCSTLWMRHGKRATTTMCSVCSRERATHLLEGESPLLRETLMAVIKQLAETDGKEFFTSETSISVVNAVIGAVATKPELITDRRG